MVYYHRKGVITTKTIGERVKAVRQHFNLTQKSFADRLGISSPSISQIESGTNNPSLQTVQLICQRFSVSEPWLKEGIGEMLVDESPAQAVLRVMEGQDEVAKSIFLSLAELPPECLEAFRQFALNLKRHLDEIPPNQKGGP